MLYGLALWHRPQQQAYLERGSVPVNRYFGNAALKARISYSSDAGVTYRTSDSTANALSLQPRNLIGFRNTVL